MVIGHSFGGLLTQILPGRWRLSSVRGDRSRAVPWRVAAPDLRVASGASRFSGNPANRKRAVPLTYEQFRFAFANAVSEEEAHRLFETSRRPRRLALPLFQAATANLNPWTEATVDTKNPARGPLLIISGEKDHTVPWAIANASLQAAGRQRRRDRARARRAARPRQAGRPDDHGLHPRGGAPDGLDRPYLVFLQGGPGFEATRPTSPPTGWMKRAVADYRVLLLDQRGTGRSTPVGSQIPGETPEAQADVPDPLPRRLDRPRCGVDPEGARRRALERPRPELRRLHLDDLPVDRTRRPAARRCSPAGWPRSAGRSTTSMARPTGG